MSDYWEYCILDAFEDAGITATKEQIDKVIGWVEGCHENYGMAHGHDCIPNPMISEVEKLSRALKKQQEDHDSQLNGVIKGVASRRNVDQSSVSIDAAGNITFGR
tara:strand:+ start:211 stop:525 length:315 start_codon:yes stop_codon:yes gene_type:complete